jgi:hypothetical protein
MKKSYEEPIVEIRNYTLPPKDVVMTSLGGYSESGGEGGLDGDDFDYFS